MSYSQLKILLGTFAAAAVMIIAPANASETLRLATTTSATNSGLLVYLLPEFTAASGITFEISSVGSGQAMRMGRRSQVDVVLVNAPAAEEDFVASGHGVKRIPFMRNSFVIVGPADTPATIANAKTVQEAVQLIASGSTKFVSRADDSGTHKRELSIWRSLGEIPYGVWYYEAGRGMKSTLSLASDMQAYTLTDTGTWLSQRASLNLIVSYQSDEPILQNPYSVIAVNPINLSAEITRVDLAERFIAWLISDAGQSLIADFRIDDVPLFVPAATSMQE